MTVARAYHHPARHDSKAPAVSSKCKAKNHGECSKLNCTCTCHPSEAK